MQAWEQFLTEQTARLGKEVVDRWLRTLRVKGFDACNLYLEAKDSFQALWFEEHIRPKLKGFRNNNRSTVKVHVVLPENAQLPRKSKGLKPGQQAVFQLSFELLKPYYTFEEFLLHNDNFAPIRLLEELCNKLTVPRLKGITAPSQSDVNPIYLHGPSGTGKTHLLQAVAHRLQRVGVQALWCSAERFTEHFVRAIRAGEMTRFRDTYRKAEVLLIDDVHVFGKKAATQEEFFHTFNALHLQGKQLLFTANCLPQNLLHMEPRLVSRFEWGCTFPIQPLSKRDAQEVLRRRAAYFHVQLPDTTIEFLTEAFPSSMKALMQAADSLVQRLQKSHSPSKPISIQLTKAVLQDLIAKEEQSALTHDRIISTTASYFGMPPEDIVGASQTRECVTPRQIAMFLCRKHLKLPYMRIGYLFSRDHSTVMAAIRQVDRQLTAIPSDAAKSVSAIELKLKRS